MVEQSSATDRRGSRCYYGNLFAISAHHTGDALQHVAWGVHLRRACRVFTCWTTGLSELELGLRRIKAVAAYDNFDNDPNPTLASGNNNSENGGELLPASLLAVRNI